MSLNRNLLVLRKKSICMALWSTQGLKLLNNGLQKRGKTHGGLFSSSDTKVFGAQVR